MQQDRRLLIPSISGHAALNRVGLRLPDPIFICLPIGACSRSTAVFSVSINFWWVDSFDKLVSYKSRSTWGSFHVKWSYSHHRFQCNFLWTFTHICNEHWEIYSFVSFRTAIFQRYDSEVSEILRLKISQYFVERHKTWPSSNFLWSVKQNNEKNSSAIFV